MVPRIEFAEDFQYAYLFNALFTFWLLVSLGAMLSFCRWRLYRWPLGLVLAGVVITFTLFLVSVSSAPSGKGSPFKKNQETWDRAVEKAEQAGMLVLDCTSHHGFIG